MRRRSTSSRSREEIPTLAGRFFLSVRAMNTYKFLGNALLTVVLPFAFAVVSSIIVSSMLASIGALMGHNTFVECFQSMIGNVFALMCFVTLIGSIIYLADRSDRKINQL